MRRGRGAGLLRESACARTWMCAANARGGPRSVLLSETCSAKRSCFTSQCEYGIEFYGAADGGGTSAKSHDDCNRQCHREKNRFDRDLGTENGLTDLACEKRSGGEAKRTADQREQR